MSFLDHIRACNNFEPARALPLFAGDDRIGLVRRDNAEALRRFPDVFTVERDRVKLGIAAPEDVTVLREELVNDTRADAPQPLHPRVPRTATATAGNLALKPQPKRT